MCQQHSAVAHTAQSRGIIVSNRHGKRGPNSYGLPGGNHLHVLLNGKLVAKAYNLPIHPRNENVWFLLASSQSQESFVKIRAGYDIAFECPHAVPLVLMLTHASVARWRYSNGSDDPFFARCRSTRLFRFLWQHLHAPRCPSRPARS
jgi:hypothetical protein